MDRSPSIDPPDGHCQYARLSFEYKQCADHGDDVVVSYGIPITVARVGGSDDIFSSQISPWITSFFALSLTTNVLATSECFSTSSLHKNFQTSLRPLRTSSHTVYTVLLSGRILWSTYRVRLYHSGSRFSVLETIVQSAALYSAALVSLLATYVARSNAQYVCLDTLQPIIVSTAFHRFRPSTQATD